MRIAVVVQRFGEGILGGAETHAGLMARLLAREHEVEVLTTTAREYHEWRDELPEGRTEEGGLVVRRFRVEQGRLAAWHASSRLLHEGFEAADFARLPAASRAAFAARVRAWPDALQEEFVRGQGPIAPGLVRHLREARYDRVLFVTYLYPTTYDGLAAVEPGRASVVPTLHDEPPAYLPVFGRRLGRARLLCSTESEIALVRRLHPDGPTDVRLLGYGIDLPAVRGEDSYGIPREQAPYLLYAGRIDTQKGIPDLLEWYRALRETCARPPRLVLVGESALPLPRLPGLEPMGFVEETRKLDLMRGALALVHPSPYESLGIVLLEAMACGTPVLVRSACDVMVEHCRRGGGGLWVGDAEEFCAAVTRLLDAPATCRALGRSGRAFVAREYSMSSYSQRILDEFRGP